MITVEHLTKEYLIRHQSGERYTALRDVIANKTKKLFSTSEKSTTEKFLALNDVSFEVKQGDKIGIIGRNGAGKSTLLKVLSRIVTPTRGRVVIEGRVASLLEVGTGFHPELSGRENIFLNGSILGMSRQEIRSKFDEIVAFSEVEKFLDTPVKRYSSGMYVRLAFSVAAHLEPEILIVDEVLAVGDAAFQKKCLGKMEDVSREGRTLLFVSHNMAAIQNLCNRALYLHHGKLVSDGAVEPVLREYLNFGSEHAGVDLLDRKDRSGNGLLRFARVEFLDAHEQLVSAFHTGSSNTLRIILHGSRSKSLSQVIVSVAIDDAYGQRITHISNEATQQIFSEINAESMIVDIQIPKLPLKDGQYSLTLFTTVGGEISDWVQNAAVMDVEAGDFYGTGKLLPEGQGSFYMDYKYRLRSQS